MLLTLAITLLNPHVYLDTVVIVGGIAGTLSPVAKALFLCGAVAASAPSFGLMAGAKTGASLVIMVSCGWLF